MNSIEYVLYHHSKRRYVKVDASNNQVSLLEDVMDATSSTDFFHMLKLEKTLEKSIKDFKVGIVIKNGYNVDTSWNTKEYFGDKNSIVSKRIWYLWVEGFSVTGLQQGASLLNHQPIHAKSFDDAVKKWNEISSFQFTYNKFTGKWSSWACVLYDNEADARKNFG